MRSGILCVAKRSPNALTMLPIEGAEAVAGLTNAKAKRPFCLKARYRKETVCMKQCQLECARAQIVVFYGDGSTHCRLQQITK